MAKEEEIIFRFQFDNKLDYKKEKENMKSWSKAVAEAKKELQKSIDALKVLEGQGKKNSDEYKKLEADVTQWKKDLDKNKLILSHYKENVSEIDNTYKAYNDTIERNKDLVNKLEKEKLGMSTSEQKAAEKRIESLNKEIDAATQKRDEFITSTNFALEGKEDEFSKIIENTLKKQQDNLSKLYQNREKAMAEMTGDSFQKKDSLQKLKALQEYQEATLKALEADSKERLNLQGLTAEEEKDIIKKTNEFITNMNKSVFAKTTEILSDASSEDLKQLKAITGNRISLAKEGSDEETKLKIQNIRIQQQIDLQSAQSDEERLAIKSRITTELLELEKKLNTSKVEANAEANAKTTENDKQTAEKKKSIASQIIEEDKKLLAAQKAGIDSFYSDLSLGMLFNFENSKTKWQEANVAYQDALIKAQQAGEITSEANANLEVLQANAFAAKMAVVDAGLEMAQNVGVGVANVMDVTQQAFEAFGEHSNAVASYSKALAVYDIALDSARAISKGVAAAQSVPFPGNIAAIATTVAAIMGNVMQARKIVKGTEIPKNIKAAGNLNLKFKGAAAKAEGGLVTGEGSGTSDSIPAWLSNGESVLTARATSMFGPILSSFNQLGGGVPFSTSQVASQVMGEDMLARAFSRAIEQMPAPVVSVEEINNTNERIKVLERYGAL